MNKLGIGLLIIIFQTFLLNAQPNSGHVPSIHPIEQIQNHYLSLQSLDDKKRQNFAWMDTIVFPPELYSRYTLALALAEPHYLTSSQIDYIVNSVEYPANSSEQTRAELDFLLDLQNNRSDEEIARVMELAAIGYWPDVNIDSSHPNYNKNLDHLFFECREVEGNDCTSENYPNTSTLLEGIMNDMRIMEFSIKYHLLRARPYQLELKLNPLRKISSPSFASGHTLWAYIQAYTFSELIPHKRKEFIDLAYEIGMSREIMGVHYPSDEEAARQIANRMLLLMWHTDKFQTDFEAAKAEWE